MKQRKRRQTKTVLRARPNETIRLYDMHSKTETDIQADHSDGLMTIVIWTKSYVRIFQDKLFE